MSNAVASASDNRVSSVCAIVSELGVTLGFSTLTIVSAMSLPSLPSPLQAGVGFGLGLVFGGVVMRAIGRLLSHPHHSVRRRRHER